MRFDRRAVLRASGLALVGGLAGCSGGPDGTDTGQPTDGGTGTTTARDTEAGTDTPVATDTATPTPTETPTETAATVPRTDTVAMVDIGFDPMVVRVSPGTEVEWVNRDGIRHNVRSAQFNGGAAQWDFASSNVGQDGRIAYTFGSAGVYEYYCAIHGRAAMCGAVLVGDVGRAGPLPCE